MIGLVLAALAAGVAVWWAVGPPPLGRLGGVPEHTGAPLAAWARAARRAVAGSSPPHRSIAAACDQLAVCVAAGLPLRVAAREVAAVSPDAVAGPLRRMLCEIDLGADEYSAWQGLASEPGWGPVARDVARSVRSGMALSGMLADHAQRARAAAHAAALVHARQAGVGAVMPLTLCFLPAFLLLGVAPLFGGLVEGLFG